MDTRTFLQMQAIFYDVDVASLPTAISFYCSEFGISETDKAKFVAAMTSIKQAKTDVDNIPDWATWTQAQAQTWYNANIGTPLQTDIPATVTLVTTRTILASMLTILRAMGTMLWALARLVIALRNKTWPVINGNTLK